MAIRHQVPFWQLEVSKLLLVQLAVCLLIGTFAWCWSEFTSGYSVMLGGCIAWLPNAWFARNAFRYHGARSMQAIVQSFWSGLAGKMILTAVLFALAFAVVKPLNVAGLFAGFVLVQMTGSASLLLMKGF